MRPVFGDSEVIPEGEILGADKPVESFDNAEAAENAGEKSGGGNSAPQRSAAKPKRRGKKKGGGRR